LKAVERKLEKLEGEIAEFPCSKPGHGDLMLFVHNHGRGLDPKEQRLIDSIRRCGKCKDKLVIELWHFGEDFKLAPPTDYEPTRTIHFELASGDPVPSVNPEVEFASWLKWTEE